MKSYNSTLKYLTLPLIFALALSACGDAKYDKYFSKRTVPGATAVKSSCNDIYGTVNMALINKKMAGTLSVKIPTVDMMKITDVASEQEMAVIKSYEEAYQSCKLSNSKIGIQTTAMEDILQARLSGMRYSLYSGEIPYGVYNYAVVKAMKEQTSFNVEAANAYAKGKKLGAENFSKMMNDIQAQQQQYQQDADRSSFYDRMENKRWSCSPSYGTSNYTCQ